jgi:plasmid stabilization system protein ParE
LIVLTARAGRQVRELQQYYETQDRIEAVRKLRASVAVAWERITANPGGGLPAPRPYPGLARPGRAWIKAGRYWIAYRTKPRLLIVAVFFETADIPGRL